MSRFMVELLWLAIRWRIDWLVALIYRRYCPYTSRMMRERGFHLARDCVRLGDCGCDNQDRYR